MTWTPSYIQSAMMFIPANSSVSACFTHWGQPPTNVQQLLKSKFSICHIMSYAAKLLEKLLGNDGSMMEYDSHSVCRPQALCTCVVRLQNCWGKIAGAGRLAVRPEAFQEGRDQRLTKYSFSVFPLPLTSKPICVRSFCKICARYVPTAPSAKHRSTWHPQCV